jgi:hypothetical protein
LKTNAISAFSSSESGAKSNARTLELNIGNVTKYSDLVLRFEPIAVRVFVDLILY